MIARSVLRGSAYLLGFIALGVAAQGIRKFLTLDPFAILRSNEILGAPDVGIRLTDVEVRQYAGPKLSARLHVGRIDIRRDRAIYELSGLKNGRYFGKEGDLSFAADKGYFNAAQHYLEVDSNASVANEDFQLRTSSLRFDERRGLLTIPGEVKGTLKGGALTATKFEYRTADESFETGPWTWTGAPVALLQEESQPGKSKWDISAKRTKGGGTKTNTNTYFEAQAGDGEIIVKSPLIEHNTKTDVLTATGNVQYFSSSANLTADKVIIYRKEKRAVLIGNVRMLVKPDADRDMPAKVEEIPPFKPVVPDDVKAARPTAPVEKEDPEQTDQLRQPKTLRDFPLVVSANQIEYFYTKGKRRAIVTGSPQARQELTNGRWRHLWAFKADYNVETEILRTESAPDKREVRMKNSIGDDLVAKWLEVSTKEDDDSYDGEDVTGTFMADEDEIPRDDKKPKDPVKPPTKKGGGLRGPISGGRTIL